MMVSHRFSCSEAKDVHSAVLGACDRKVHEEEQRLKGMVRTKTITNL